jgi:hypothetical protein
MSTDPKQDDAWKYAQRAMSWYGWGSPVGLGLFLVAIALVILLLRFAWVM